MTITPADVPCIICGRSSEITMSVEHGGVIAHYGSCAQHIEQAARRVHGDVASIRAPRPAQVIYDVIEPPKPAAPVGQIADAFGVPVNLVSDIIDTTATEDRAAYDPNARYKDRGPLT